MLSNLVLRKPLAVIDLETTGLDVSTARIVEISVLKITPNDEQIQRTRRLNPQVPIPPEASTVHHITDADVTHEPAFAQVAAALLQFLDGCDLCGFNLKKFDLRVLYNEFKRAGLTLPLEGRDFIDPLEIFYRYEPRTLEAAVRLYLGQSHEGSHSAAADVRATAQVLNAMLARYEDLPREVPALAATFVDPTAVDSHGMFTRTGDQVRFNKGKFRGQPLSAVAEREPDYLRWMLAQPTFPDDTKALVHQALRQPKDACIAVPC